MQIVLTLFQLLLSLNWCYTTKLHLPFQKCDKTQNNFDLCLSESIREAIQQLSDPLDEYGLPDLEPFVAPQNVAVEFGDENMALRQKYSNYVIYGLTKINSTSARLDLERTILSLNISFSENVVFKFNYENSGVLIVLPMNVSTAASVTLTNPTFRITFHLQESQEKHQYFKVHNGKLKMEAQMMKLNFKNLFKNKRLNEELNKEFNENWEVIFNNWQLVTPRMFIQTFEDIFNNLLQRVPTRDLFDGL